MIKQWLQNRQILLSLLVVLIGGVIGAVILTTGGPAESGGEHGESSPAAETYPKGPHGGKLLTSNDLSIEVTIYEDGVPPVFRVYLLDDEQKVVNPADLKLRAEVRRLGPVVDRLDFAPENDYLLGDSVIYEPHSFDVTLFGERAGKSYQWKYSQTEGRTRMSAAAAKTSGVALETSGPTTMKSMLSLPGEIVANTDRVAHVVPRLPGVITEVRRSVGDRVGKGEVLAVLQSRELADLSAAHAAASKRVTLAQQTATREESLFRKKIGAEQDLQQAQHALAEARIEQQTAAQKLRALGVTPGAGAGAAMTRIEVRAPFSGTIIERRVSVGEAVSDAAPIFVVADLSTVWVDITVPARDLENVKAGQKVIVKSDATEAQAAGTVTFVSALVGEQTRSAKARVLLQNPNSTWRPGLFVTVQVVQEEISVPVAVRLSALQTFRDWDVVFMQDGEWYEARPLELGRRDDTWVEVLEGLPAGVRYVAENSFILKADVEKSGASHDH